MHVSGRVYFDAGQKGLKKSESRYGGGLASYSSISSIDVRNYNKRTSNANR